MHSKEAFVHLHPVWMRMFQEDPQFLADDQPKANFLFQLLRDSSLAEIPGAREVILNGKSRP